MDFKKVLDQTVRELKREVNKTILKVPEIEQKVLDATSNEPWGPHGTLMAEIAQATRNYYELQMIMTILWKRLSDTGRNWRHVYKALTVMEYLVAHGSEKVIDDINQHSYQIVLLADFHYVEPNGKDQGINVRKKARTLMSVVNDKEKIREVRQKAADNRDKYRGVSSMGGISKSTSYQSTGGSYGGDRYTEDNYGRHGLRDDDRYSRDGDVDRYRDDDLYGRQGERSSGASDRYRDGHNRDYDDDVDSYGSRKEDDQHGDKHRGFENDSGRAHKDSDDSRRPVQKSSKPVSTSGPPGYEEASQSPDHRELKSMPGESVSSSSANVPLGNNISDDFDDFNPRATSVAAPSQLGDLFNQSEQSSAVRGSSPSPVSSSLFGDTNDIFGDTVSSSGTFAPSLNLGEDLFGNSPFKIEVSGSSSSTVAQAAIKPPPNYIPPPSTGNVVKASVLPGAGSLPASVRQPTTFPGGNIAAPMGGAIFDAFGPGASTANQAANFGGGDFFGLDTSGVSGTVSSSTQEPAFTLNALQASAHAMSGAFQTSQPFVATSSSNPSPFLGTSGQVQPAGNVRLQQEKRFETKSAVWADSLSKGLIDLNLAGPKSNPLADIGIDFDQLRTERIKDERMSTGKSTLGMGKAMGSGSGRGVAGASALVSPAAPVALNNMGMASMMGMGMGIGTSMGPMMQMGLNPGLAVRPGTGMGAGTGMGVGMGVNSAMAGFPNQQQQYGGFR